MTDVESILDLDIDWDFLNHLAIPDSWATLKSEAFSSELLEDEYAIRIYDWQNAHAREHALPAKGSVLEDQFDDLVLEAPQTAIGDLLIRLRARYLKNYGRDAIRGIGAIYKDDPLETGPAMIRKGRELVALTQGRGESWGTGDTDRSILEYHKTVTKGMGPSFGFKELDDHFFGERGLTFSLGSPKVGKSWLATKAVVQNILEGNYTELYALELPAYEAQMRVRCMVADIPWWKFIRCQFDEQDLAKLTETGD